MSGGFFRGTSADQDTRFSNKEAKLLKSQKFAAELEHPVDMSKVKMDVIRPWIATRVTELLGFEDEVLINFIYGLLDKKSVDGKQIQIQLTGFMEKNTGRFMKELWALLLSAQNNVSGVPQQFLDAKEEESRKKQGETDRIKNEILWRKSKENKELEEEYKKKMEAEVDSTRANTHDTSGRKRSMFSDANVDMSEVGRSADLRAIDRIVKSPLELELGASRRSRSKSLTRDRSSSRSPPAKVRHESKSVSRSPMHQSDSVERRSYSQSRSPPRRHSPRRLRSPPKRRSPHLRRRSPSPSRSPIRRRSPSPSRRRNPTFSRSRLTSPVRRRSPSPGGNRSLSSSRQRSMSPARRRSRSPLRSPSPNYRKSSNPVQRRSPSPVRRQRSPSPVRRQRSPSPVRRRRSPSPVRRRRSPSPVRRRRSSPPTRRRSPPPTRRRSPSPVRRRSPYVRSPRYPRRSPKASPRRHDFDMSPQRRQRRSRSPYREGSPYRGRRNISQEQEGRLNGFETTEHQDRRTDRVRGRRSPARVGLIDEGDQLNQMKNSSAVARLPVTSLRSPQRDMRSLSHKGPTLSSDERQISDGYESSEPAYETSRRDARRETTYNSPIRSSRDTKVRHDSPATSIEQEGLEKSRDNVSQKNQSAKTFHALYDEVEYAPGRPENNSFNHEGISIGEDPDAGVDKREKHRKFGKRSGYINDDEVGRDGETRKLKREGSNTDDDNVSPRDEKKEAKRRKKEDRRMRKEEKRRRREERHRRREERRANKTKTKSVDTVTPPSDLDENRDAAGHLSDDDAYVLKGSHQSDGEDVESEQKRLEIELRERALESLKAKKAIIN